MSRLIVKNLPKIISEDKIREIFSENGTVTDIQLKYTSDGKFRQFCFIGYQNDKDANKALEALNNTFIKTSKISVEHCALLGDGKKPQAWSKYASDSTAFRKKYKQENKEEIEENKEVEKNERKKNRKNKTIELLEKYKDDPLFDEYLEAHSAKDVTKILIESKNEEIDEDKNKKMEEQQEGEEGSSESDNDEKKLANDKISDLEYMNQLKEKTNKPRQKMEKKIKEKVELYTLKLKNLPYSCKKKDIKIFFKPLKPHSIRVPPKIHGIAYVGFKDEKLFNKGLLKDRSFISGNRIFVMKYEKGHQEEQLQSDPKRTKWKSQEESLKIEEDIAESGRIFVRNLSYTTTEDDLQALFNNFGPLTEVNLPIDSTSRKMKGFGTITFLMPEHAVKAYTELDGSVLHGRMLHLLPAKNKDTPEGSSEDSSNYKQKKAAKQKSQAGMSHNWNALFLGHDAVAEVVADTYGTTKEAVVGPQSKGSAAVRLALGETQIVTQTKKYLEQEGVILDAFASGGTKRSKTIILVKNLPAKTTSRELADIFEKHGVLGRIILPPSAITAIIEFVEPSEARKAFTKLAYTKFKNMPLYLEWAPENILTEAKGPKTPFEKTEDSNPTTEIPTVDHNSDDERPKEEETLPSDDEEPEPDTTIFVKNLNFKSTEADFKKHFEKCGKIHYATIATKKDKNDPNSVLSLGYGFVRLKTQAALEKALKTLQQSVLDGKSLELKRSERTLQNEVQTIKKKPKKQKQTGSKILVRNVPFQANKNEVQELFATFGEIKALRLPQKMSGESHRGFAFVDYTTESDAKKAFEGLSQSTHLYGRRLVLEWASSEENVEEIRKRTAEHFESNKKDAKRTSKGVFNLE